MVTHRNTIVTKRITLYTYIRNIHHYISFLIFSVCNGTCFQLDTAPIRVTFHSSNYQKHDYQKHDRVKFYQKSAPEIPGEFYGLDVVSLVQTNRSVWTHRLRKQWDVPVELIVWIRALFIPPAKAFIIYFWLYMMVGSGFHLICHITTSRWPGRKHLQILKNVSDCNFSLSPSSWCYYI